MDYQFCSGNGGSGSYAPSNRTHIQGETFMCLWVGVGGLHCSELICGSNISAHLRQAHGIHGPDKNRVLCRWTSCNREFNKENLARHVEEIHLGIVYPCPGCGSTFSRKDTLNRHRMTLQH